MAQTAITSGAGDGSINKDDATWAGARGATSGGSSYTNTVADLVSRSNSGTSFTNARGFLVFDTSSLPDNQEITAVTLKIYITNLWQNAGSIQLTVVEASQASTSSLTGADYDNIGTVELASRVTAAAGALTFTLNATGRALINKKGYTKLAIVTSKDFDNSAPVDGSSELDALFATSENATSANRPTLTVTYFPKVRKKIWIYPDSIPTTASHLSSGTNSHSFTSVSDYIRASMTRSTGSGYYYVDLTSITDYTIQTGDYIEYDVYWETANCLIAVDLTTSAGTLRDTNGQPDQNGLAAHPSTNINTQAFGQWYHRKISLSGLVGGTITNYDIVTEWDGGATTLVARLKNIAITGGNGVTSVKKFIGVTHSFIKEINGVARDSSGKIAGVVVT